MNRFLLTALGTGVALGLCAQAQAGVIFDDTFSAEAGALEGTVADTVGGTWVAGTGTMAINDTGTGVAYGSTANNDVASVDLADFGSDTVIQVDVVIGSVGTTGNLTVALTDAAQNNALQSNGRSKLCVQLIPSGGFFVYVNNENGGTGANRLISVPSPAEAYYGNGDKVSIVVDIAADTLTLLVNDLGIGYSNVALVEAAGNVGTGGDPYDFVAGDANFLAIQAGGAADGTFDRVTVTTTPEPGSLALLGIGGLLIARRRRA